MSIEIGTVRGQAEAVFTKQGLKTLMHRFTVSFNVLETVVGEWTLGTNPTDSCAGQFTVNHELRTDPPLTAITGSHPLPYSHRRLLLGGHRHVKRVLCSECLKTS